MKRTLLLLSVLPPLLLLAFLLSLALGSSGIPLSDLLGGLFARPGYETEAAILLYIRLPRTLAALLAGAALSLSGVLLQHVLTNPLASPNTVGVNAGAGFFTILHLSLFPAAAALLPLAALLGAFLTALLVVTIARAAGGGRGTVILSGIICSSLFGAGISFFSILDTDILSQYSAFSIGGFAGVRSEALTLPAILTVLTLLTALLLTPRIAALSLGDSVASSLGIRTRALRTVVLLLAAASAAAAISFSGLLGFVGLAVPHITRRLTGEGLRRELAVAPLLGALLLLLADLAARTLFAPSEIPVGILTTTLGAPFFLILLIKRRGPHA